jgi:hypothetical protein
MLLRVLVIDFDFAQDLRVVCRHSSFCHILGWTLWTSLLSSVVKSDTHSRGLSTRRFRQTHQRNRLAHLTRTSERGSGGTADALASGASWSNPVGVRIPPSAPLILKDLADLDVLQLCAVCRAFCRLRVRKPIQPRCTPLSESAAFGCDALSSIALWLLSFLSGFHPTTAVA